MSRTTPESPRPTVFPRLVVLALTLWAGAARADLVKVTSEADAIPAPPGSLRAAIEKTEVTPGPDRIEFADNVATIVLAAPLPQITQGRLTIGRPVPFDPSRREIAPQVTISGAAALTHALQITGPDVGLHGLGFEGFVGAAAVEYSVPPTTIDVSSCRFAGSSPGNNGAGLSIRVNAVSDQRAQIDVRHSEFFGNARGLEVKIASTAADSQALRVRNNRFGRVELLPSPSAGETAMALANGRWLVTGNVVVNRGTGFEISGAEGTTIAHNEFGFLHPLIGGCSGPDLGLLALRLSPRARVEANTVNCSPGDGFRVLAGSDGAIVEDNRIAAGSLDGPVAGVGIVVEDAGGVLVRHNAVRSSDIAIAVRGLAARTVVSCNQMFGDVAPLLVVPPSSPPPTVHAASSLSARVSVLDPAPGWVELFSGSTPVGLRFHGSHATPPDDADLSLAFEVLDLRVRKSGTTASIAWDETVDPVVTATRGRSDVNSSKPAASVVVDTSDTVFDVIRGSVGALARANDGSVDLGTVTCLADDRVPGTSSPVTDPGLPPAGKAFFYVVRRDTPLTPRAGSYDPAVCGVDLRSFQGPRRAASGDCGP